MWAMAVDMVAFPDIRAAALVFLVAAVLALVDIQAKVVMGRVQVKHKLEALAALLAAVVLLVAVAVVLEYLAQAQVEGLVKAVLVEQIHLVQQAGHTAAAEGLAHLIQVVHMFLLCQAVVQYVLFGQVQLVVSHQLVQETCNEYQTLH
jgi:hypothetical protein